jgi:hypothetical protein
MMLIVDPGTSYKLRSFYRNTHAWKRRYSHTKIVGDSRKVFLSGVVEQRKSVQGHSIAEPSLRRNCMNTAHSALPYSWYLDKDDVSRLSWPLATNSSLGAGFWRRKLQGSRAQSSHRRGLLLTTKTDNF